MKKTEAIIFAAGQASRYGDNKLLLPIGDVPAMIYAIRTLCAAGVDRIAVITGAYHDTIKQALIREPVRIFLNPRHSEGMSATICFSVQQIDQSSESILLLPGDVPLFSRQTIKTMMQYGLTHRIVIPRYQGKKGHPVLVDRKIVEECLETGLEMPLYEVIQNHQNEVFYLDSDDQGVVLDIDTREDYDAILSYFKTTYGSY
ncbi:MAG TPA: nucleotidyltransferase family protein [bacterium]|nr:nucleotidyltransferase family protein [bacterium]HMW32629.1 nucleotidyltransferase family protein [bacterium]HMW35170.1 nucleotidyltransferase family protein [bacterium]HMY36564.1 nucleotidyltransferase family protein [bacterium]HMZ03165.1 nucleotidyltransferase family protein [bacterium]